MASKYEAPQGPPPSYPSQPAPVHHDTGPVMSPQSEVAQPYYQSRGQAQDYYGQDNQGYYGPPQGYQGYPPQGYPPQGYPQQGYYPQQGGMYYQQPQGYYGDARGRSTGGDALATGLCAGLCASLCCLDLCLFF